MDPALKEQLRGLARTTSIEQLARRGVKKVRITRLDRIVELVEEAVRRSQPGAPTGAAGATRVEFLRLLQGQQELERSRDEALRSQLRAERETAALRRELAASRQALAEELAQAERDMRARHRTENAEIASQVDQLVEGLGLTANADARARMLALVMGAVDHERTATAQERQLAHDREVDLLERRIAKLIGSLRETEAALSRVRHADLGDDGIASIYQRVQGLDAHGPFAEQKRALMADIFEANLRLQGRALAS